MKKKLLNLSFCIVGFVGALIFSIVAIADSQSSDIISVLPITMLCCSLFIAGYLSYRSDDKKDK